MATAPSLPFTGMNCEEKSTSFVRASYLRVYGYFKRQSGKVATTGTGWIWLAS
jgi:hypothetical protein